MEIPEVNIVIFDLDGVLADVSVQNFIELERLLMN